MAWRSIVALFAASGTWIEVSRKAFGFVSHFKFNVMRGQI